MIKKYSYWIKAFSPIIFTLIIFFVIQTLISQAVGLNKKSDKHFPAIGEATLCGVIVECDIETGLARNIENFIYGGELKNSH